MASWFDNLSVAMARGMTRRQTLAAISGGVAAVTFLGPLGPPRASAGPGCGRACQDAGHRTGSPEFVACVHRCGAETTTCEANALQACLAIDPLAVTVTVTCCGGTGTCNFAGVCVCPDSTLPECLGTIDAVPTSSCCTGLQTCDAAAGVCLN
jgi:hypothetical protein